MYPSRKLDIHNCSLLIEYKRTAVAVEAICYWMCGQSYSYRYYTEFHTKLSLNINFVLLIVRDCQYDHISTSDLFLDLSDIGENLAELWEVYS
jgi:hypothetical protein